MSFEEPVRFIFSHSALREGWDNPNVFVMCMLKHSDNTISRRQEVGRGLRLVASTRTATGWTIQPRSMTSTSSPSSPARATRTSWRPQKEIADTLSSRPRKADEAYFTGKSDHDAMPARSKSRRPWQSRYTDIS